jgi:hypothetical protein
VVSVLILGLYFHFSFRKGKLFCPYVTRSAASSTFRTFYVMFPPSRRIQCPAFICNHPLLSSPVRFVLLLSVLVAVCLINVSYNTIANCFSFLFPLMERPRVVDGGDGFQIWKVAANILNKQSRTVNKEWSTSLWVGWWTRSSTLKKTQLVTKCYIGLQTWKILWNDSSGLRQGSMAGCCEHGNEPPGS